MTILKPSRKLFEYLRPKAVIERASFDQFAKLGGVSGEAHQYHLLSNGENKFVLEYGPGVENLVFSLTENEAFEKLAAAIGDYKKVRFHLLWLPGRGVLHCSADVHDDVAMRVIEYYEMRIDEVLTRYDVLVEVVA